MAEPPRPARVRRHVGRSNARAGGLLQARGAVRDRFLEGGCLFADVADGETFSVRVWVDEGDVTGSSCTCGEGEACRHVAAALADWAAAPDPAPPTRPGTETGPPATADAAAGAPPLGADADVWRSWARRSGVRFSLDQRAADLPELPPGLADFFWYAPYGTTVEQVLTGQARGARPLQRPLQEHVRAWLMAQVAQARAALDWEQEREAIRSQEPGPLRRRDAWQALTDARGALRVASAPTVTDRRPRRHLKVEEDPPRLIFHAASLRACGSGEPVRVRLDLRPEGGRPAVQCQCPGPARTGCPYALAACDVALDLIADDDGSDLLAALDQALASTPWERALGELDRVLGGLGAAGSPDDDDAADPDARLPGWRLHLDPSAGPAAEAVDVQPYKTRPGLRAWPVPLADRAARPLALPLDADRRALRALEPPPPDGAAPLPALLALEGHPRLVDAAGSRLHLRTATASLWWTATPEGGLQLDLAIDGQILAPERTRQLLTPRSAPTYLTWVDDAVWRIAPLEPGAWALLSALDRRGWSYPPEAIGPLLEREADLSRLLPIHLDEKLRGERITGDPRPLLRLDAMPGGALAVDVRLRPLPDGPAFPPGEGPEQLTVVRPDGRVYVQRGLDGEAESTWEALEPLPGLDPPMVGWRRYLDDPEAALDLVFALQAQDFVQVEWAGERRRVSRAAEATDVEISVGGGRDWLGLEGTADVDGLLVDLAVLLEAAREGRRYVAVDDAAWVRISDRLQAQLEEVAAAAWSTKRGLELSPYAAEVLDGLAAAGAELELPESWAPDRAAAAAAQDLPVAPPSNLQATLRPYQRVGLQWMARLAAWAPGACLADDMGLGKTIQALSLLLLRAEGGPTLVVAPTSVGPNWRAEARRFSPSLKVALYRGRGREGLLNGIGAHDVLITSYDLVVRDAAALGAVSWHTLVLDEAQAIKNPTTRRAQAIHSLDRAFCLALTGTPVENRTGELWSLFAAIVPGLLGSAEAFRERFAIPIERWADVDRQRQLSRLIRPFLLRRLKREVAPDLPPRIEQTVRIELSAAERRLYDRARLAALAELSGPEAGDPDAQRFRLLAALSRLRQLACHPRLDDPNSTVPSAKLAATLELLGEAFDAGHRVLVFSQFTRHLALVRAALEAQGRSLLYLDGGTPLGEREARVAAFQRGTADAFLISLKAGGTGLNLTAATVVLHLDPWWNPAVEDQATDRAHRIGQDAPVNVYRLVAEGTIEQAIVELHAEKRALAASLLGEAGAPVRFDADELLDLLRG